MFRVSYAGRTFAQRGEDNSSPRFACPITQKAGTLATKGAVGGGAGVVPNERPDRA